MIDAGMPTAMLWFGTIIPIVILVIVYSIMRGIRYLARWYGVR